MADWYYQSLHVVFTSFVLFLSSRTPTPNNYFVNLPHSKGSPTAVKPPPLSKFHALDTIYDTRCTLQQLFFLTIFFYNSKSLCYFTIFDAQDFFFFKQLGEICMNWSVLEAALDLSANERRLHNPQIEPSKTRKS